MRRLSWQFAARYADARWYNSSSVWATWEPRRRRPTSARVPTVSQMPDRFVEPSARSGFVFVGRLVGSKGVDLLIDAYRDANLNPAIWPLTIIGDGPDRAALEHRATSTGRDDVQFLGFLSEDAKSAHMAGAKWLVAPSHAHEGLGLVALEARHAGVPCIVTRHGGLPEAAGREALICEPGDVSSLAVMLRTAAAMPDGEYEARSARTKNDLGEDLVPASFYSDAYLRVIDGHGSR
jgi:glycosyltransferase involved in cell wall biosynthesis